MSFSKLASIANAGHSVATALSALSTDSESVPESSPAYTGGAASAIGLHPPVAPAPFPASPFYTPPVQVSDTEIKKEAEIRSAFLLAKLRFGSSVVRNLVAEIIVKASDEETLQQWESQQLSTPPTGSAAAKALKRIGIKNRLKDFKSPMTDEDGELVELLKEALFLDLKEQAQRGQFRKMGYDEMLTKLISIEFMGLGESLTGPLTELFKETLSKNPS